jgi:hypothetical protein
VNDNIGGAAGGQTFSDWISIWANGKLPLQLQANTSGGAQLGTRFFDRWATDKD